MLLDLHTAAGWPQHTNDEITILNAYVTNVESQLRLGLDSFVSEIKEGVLGAGTPYELDIRIYDGLEDNNWQIESIFGEYFPQLHRGSVLLTLCAYFEDSLNNLCHRYQRDYQLTPPSRRGIDEARQYLTRTVGLDLTGPGFQNCWEKIKAIFAIRNALAHADGRINESDTKARAAVHKLKYVELNGTKLKFASDFLHYVLQGFRELTWALQQAHHSAPGKPHPGR